MLILATVLINVVAIAIWSAITGQNGFAEAAKMLRGEPAFIREAPKPSGSGGPLTGDPNKPPIGGGGGGAIGQPDQGKNDPGGGGAW